MSEKERQKKDHQRKDKDRQRMRESGKPRKQQASIRYGAENKSDDTRRQGAPATGKG
jgi:hypothetical protein